MHCSANVAPARRRLTVGEFVSSRSITVRHGAPGRPTVMESQASAGQLPANAVAALLPTPVRRSVDSSRSADSFFRAVFAHKLAEHADEAVRAPIVCLLNRPWGPLLNCWRIPICKVVKASSTNSVMKRFFLALFVATVALPLAAQTKTLLNLDKTGLAIQGYDPVAFFTDGKPVKGKPEFIARQNGALYYFASKEHRDSFKADPAKYEPAFGGYLAFGVSRMAALSVSIALNEKGWCADQQTQFNPKEA